MSVADQMPIVTNAEALLEHYTDYTHASKEQMKQLFRHFATELARLLPPDVSEAIVDPLAHLITSTEKIAIDVLVKQLHDINKLLTDHVTQRNSVLNGLQTGSFLSKNHRAEHVITHLEGNLGVAMSDGNNIRTTTGHFDMSCFTRGAPCGPAVTRKGGYKKHTAAAAAATAAATATTTTTTETKPNNV